MVSLEMPSSPTPEMMEHFKELAMRKENSFLACPEEARLKRKEVIEQAKETFPTEFDAVWKEHDLNKDGGLNESEWIEFSKVMFHSGEKIYGWEVPFDEDLVTKVYHAIVTFTPHDSGVTREGIIPWLVVSEAVRKELNL